MNYMAADILSQLGLTASGAEDQVARISADMVLAWRWRQQPTPLHDRRHMGAKAMEDHRFSSARCSLVQAVVSAATATNSQKSSTVNLNGK
jgi:hypothetical protein